MSFDPTGADAPLDSSRAATTRDFTRLINALFDDRESADQARQDLVAAGIPAGDIAVSGENFGTVHETDDAPARSEGFWDTLIDIFMPAKDRHSYDEGVRRGGITVSVRSDTASHDRIVEILDRDGAVDLDEREESWRKEGWTGYAPGTEPIADPRSLEPGLIPQVTSDEEPSYAKPSNATAGFGASQADHFPVGEAPPVPSPGALPEGERVATPDAAYAGAAPGLSPNPGAPAVPSTADGAGAVSSGQSAAAPRAPTGTRDTALGRPRIRSYTTAGDDDGAPPVG